MVLQVLFLHQAWCCGSCHHTCTTCGAVIVPAPCVVLSSCLCCMWCCSHPAIAPHAVLWSLPLHCAWCCRRCCCAAHGGMVTAIVLGMVSPLLLLRHAWFMVVVSQLWL